MGLSGNFFHSTLESSPTKVMVDFKQLPQDLVGSTF